MDSSLLNQQLIAFERALGSLEQLVFSCVSPEDAQAKHPQISSIFQQTSQLQTQFQAILAATADAAMAPETEQRIRPFKTEAHRRLRLLGIEAMRLQSARATDTFERCRTQMQVHLSQLRQFVQAIAQTLKADTQTK